MTEKVKNSSHNIRSRMSHDEQAKHFKMFHVKNVLISDSRLTTVLTFPCISYFAGGFKALQEARGSTESRKNNIWRRSHSRRKVPHVGISILLGKLHRCEWRRRPLKRDDKIQHKWSEGNCVNHDSALPQTTIKGHRLARDFALCIFQLTEADSKVQGTVADNF